MRYMWKLYYQFKRVETKSDIVIRWKRINDIKVINMKLSREA